MNNTAYQIPIKFHVEPSYQDEDYIVSKSNEEAYHLSGDPKLWNGHALIILGEGSCGKTHLSKIRASQTGGFLISGDDLDEGFLTLLQKNNEAGTFSLVIDDVDLIFGNHEKETVLFHLMNWFKEVQGQLLMTVSTPRISWDISLPDLSSRLKATPVVTLEQPDDEVLSAVLFKLFSDRQLQVSKEVVDYLIPRVRRSMAFLVSLVKAIDAEALSQSRKITIPFVKTILEREMG